MFNSVNLHALSGRTNFGIFGCAKKRAWQVALINVTNALCTQRPLWDGDNTSHDLLPEEPSRWVMGGQTGSPVNC